MQTCGVPFAFGDMNRVFTIEPIPPGKLRLRVRPNSIWRLYARHNGTTRVFWLECKLPFSSGILIPHELGRNETLEHTARTARL